MSPAGTPVLYQITFSHFNEKARWALDHHRIAHRRESLMPGVHPRASRKLGGVGTTPILVLGDGEVISDSSDIIAWAEAHGSGSPLYPADEAQRRRALELEQHFDQNLGPQVRCAVFHAVLPHRRAAVGLFSQQFGAGTRLMTNAMYPLVRVGARKAVDASDENAERGRRMTVEAMDRLESELGDGNYLVGDGFTSADLGVAALFSPLVSPPEFPYEHAKPVPREWADFRASHRDRPGYQWVEETYRRHRGSSAEV
jgi:glutathione S-transferase